MSTTRCSYRWAAQRSGLTLGQIQRLVKMEFITPTVQEIQRLVEMGPPTYISPGTRRVSLGVPARSRYPWRDKEGYSASYTPDEVRLSASGGYHLGDVDPEVVLATITGGFVVGAWRFGKRVAQDPMGGRWQYTLRDDPELTAMYQNTRLDIGRGPTSTDVLPDTSISPQQGLAT